MPTIVVKIDKFGQPIIEANGFAGMSCKKATASLEKAYSAGASEVKETKKPEMFVAETTRTTLTNRGG